MRSGVFSLRCRCLSVKQSCHTVESQTMSYSNQYRGSPWQQDRQLFDVSRYSQMYRGYGLSNQLSMMSSCYSHNQEAYRSMYGSGAVNAYRSMGYDSPFLSAYYPSDRTSSYQSFYGRIQQKRISQKVLTGGPISKRPKLENGSYQDRSRTRWRRRRDRRRARRSNKSDNKSVGTAEDVTNINDDDYDSWKSSEDENETTSVTQDKKQQSANDEEKITVKTDELDKTKGAKKPLACHVCKVRCSTLERFGNHMTSRTHRLKMEKLLVLQQEKKQALEASMKASQQVESEDRSKKDRNRQRQWCTVCEHTFFGNFLAHRRRREHRRNRDKKRYPKCQPCGTEFKSVEAYKEHCKVECHKAKSAEFHYLRNLASGSDDDIAATEPVKVDTPTVIQEGDQKAEATEGIEKSEEKKEVGGSESECEQSAKTKEIEPVAVGQLFVVSAKGYYCKICHKFFRDATIARVKHCCSIMHSEAFEKAMKEAVEQEEDRQKLAVEHERLEQEAAEVARIDAQIAAVEKAAEMVAKKETNGKKEVQKTNDIESKKSSSQNGNASVEVEVSDDANVVKKMEVTEEKIKGVEDVEGNTTVGKVEVSDNEGAIKKEGTHVLVEETKDVEEVKGETESHEVAQSDSQGNKECEGTKKESPGSRGTRRGGRGRGRRR